MPSPKFCTCTAVRKLLFSLRFQFRLPQVIECGVLRALAFTSAQQNTYLALVEFYSLLYCSKSSHAMNLLNKSHLMDLLVPCLD